MSIKSQDAYEAHQSGYDVAWSDAIEACAALCEKMPMSEILLAAGEMTAGERRTVRALQKWFAHKIRTQNS